MTAAQESWIFTHPQVIQYVDSFNCSSGQIWRYAHPSLNIWLSSVNGCHQNESPNRPEVFCFLQTCHKRLIDGLDSWITCALLWCFHELFGLLFWRHPLTAEDQLMSILCKMLNFSKSVLNKKKKIICILDGLRLSTFFNNFPFSTNYSFKRA